MDSVHKRNCWRKTIFLPPKCTAYISPPIAAVFLWGIMNPKLNSKGAMSCLWTGFILGVSRLLLEVFKSSLDQNGVLFSIVSINFLHFAVILFIICSLVLIIVSSITGGETKNVDKITFNKTNAKDEASESSTELIWSIGLCLAVFGIWIYFS